MVYLGCEMSPGGFSGEIAFQIECQDGTKHVGLAARRYFWTDDGNPVGTLKGRSKGLVAARIIEDEGDKLLVSIPDGEVVEVKRNQVRSESAPDVPVRS